MGEGSVSLHVVNFGVGQGDHVLHRLYSKEAVAGYLFVVHVSSPSGAAWQKLPRWLLVQRGDDIQSDLINVCFKSTLELCLPHYRAAPTPTRRAGQKLKNAGKFLQINSG